MLLKNLHTVEVSVTDQSAYQLRNVWLDACCNADRHKTASKWS